MPIIRDKFDFEIGYLTKSPCRDCPHFHDLPSCSNECRVLDRIRIILARGISCTGTHHFLQA